MKNRQEFRFPILLSNMEHQEFDCPLSIRWGDIAPHAVQALKNHRQTLLRLAERGGLGPDELVAVLEDRPWRSMDMREAINRVKQLTGCTQAGE